MRTFRMLLATAAGAAALAGTPAMAGTWHCYGTAAVGVVCYQTNLPTVDPNGNSYEDCIIVNNQCTVPISVPIPTVTPSSGGPIVDVTCGGTWWQCNL